MTYDVRAAKDGLIVTVSEEDQYRALDGLASRFADCPTTRKMEFHRIWSMPGRTFVWLRWAVGQ